MTMAAAVDAPVRDRSADPGAAVRLPEEPRGVGYRLQLTAVCLFLAFIAFIQSPGLLWSDSKIDLAIEPASFLTRALRLWEPLSGGGQLQNQAYGYLFPMGPWFAGWDAVGLPTWIAQRGWMALLLVTGFLGIVRLAGALGVGSPWTRMVAGLAYVMAPRLLMIIGPISSEALPMVMLPWALLPLLRATSGHLSPRRAAGLYGLAVVCMGGVNATATLAVLPLPALYLLTREPSRTRRSLAGWWALATVLATAWWFIPLVLLGRYSFPFLDYVETAAATTSRTSLVEILRGTTHWVGYLVVNGQPWWQAAQPLVSNPVVVLETALLAAVGVAGLTRRELPHRRFLTLALLGGVAAVSLGHAGPFTGPWSLEIQAALDGVLAPFRNVHKFDPVVRLPLALGTAHWLSVVVPSRLRALAVGLCGVLLIGVAAPALTGRLGPAGAFDGLPTYWRDASTWLAAQDREARTLLLPGDGFGQFTWGRTVDEPIQPYAEAPWWVRQQAAALPGTGATRLLDSIEQVVDRGRPAPGLPDVLARSGVRFVLVRNDLDWSHTGGPRPSAVAATLEQTAGLTLVAEFGPVSGGEAIGTAVVDTGLGQPRPAVQIYEVKRPTAPATVQPLAGAVVLSGGPEQLLDLVAHGILGSTQPAILAADAFSESVPEARGVITDGLPRRTVAFGQIRDNVSETYVRERAFEVRTPDLAPVVSGSLQPGVLLDHSTVIRFLGIDDVRASSSASDPGSAIEGDVSRAPFAPIDGISRTVWLSGSVSAAGQWWEIDFDGVRALPAALPVTIAASSLLTSDVTRIRVTTDTGWLETAVHGAGPVALRVPSGSTRTLRIQAVQFGQDPVTRGMFGLARVELAGVHPQRVRVAPADLPSSVSGSPDVLLTGGGDRSDGCILLDGAPRCAEALRRTGEEAGIFDRVFSSAVGGTYRLEVAAVPTDGVAAESLIRARDPWAGRVESSSALTPGAATSAAAALDGDLATSWSAARSDRAPALSFRWDEKHAVGGIRVTVAGDAMVSSPRRIRVTMDGRSEEAWLEPLVAAPPGPGPGTGGGVLQARFPVLVGSELKVEVVESVVRGDVEPTYGGLRRLATGITEIALVDGGGAVVRPDASAVQQSAGGSLKCGTVFVLVDGVRVDLEGKQSLAQTVRGEQTVLRPCLGAAALQLAAGTHRVTWPGGSYEALNVLLAAEGARPPSAASRQLDIGTWTAERRSVAVGAGAAAILVVHENVNAGWRATVDGQVLAVVVVDGWQQGWVLPASGPVQVALEYVPTRSYRVGLLVGLALILLLVVLTAIPGRATRPVGEASGRLASVVTLAAAALLILFMGGPFGMVAASAGFLVALRRPDRRDILVLGLMGAAGCVAASALLWRSPWPQAVQALTQPALLAVLGAVAASLLPRGGWSNADAPVSESVAPGGTSSPTPRPESSSW